VIISAAAASNFPNADDEYTPAQRRVIDARLDESEEDLKKGRTAGPFNSANEMVVHLKGELRKRAAAKARGAHTKPAQKPAAGKIARPTSDVEERGAGQTVTRN